MIVAFYIHPPPQPLPAKGGGAFRGGLDLNRTAVMVRLGTMRLGMAITLANWIGCSVWDTVSIYAFGAWLSA